MKRENFLFEFVSVVHLPFFDKRSNPELRGNEGKISCFCLGKEMNIAYRFSIVLCQCTCVLFWVPRKC